MTGLGQAQVTETTNPILYVIVTPASRDDVLALNLHKQCSVSQYFCSRNTFSLVSIYGAHVFCGPSFIE